MTIDFFNDCNITIVGEVCNSTFYFYTFLIIIEWAMHDVMNTFMYLRKENSKSIHLTLCGVRGSTVKCVFVKHIGNRTSKRSINPLTS